MNKDKIRGERIFKIIHCPFEGWAKLHHSCQPNGPVGRCYLGGNSKGQCTISKILFPLFLYTFIEQNIFFPETCFAHPISEQKFMVCFLVGQGLKLNCFLHLLLYKFKQIKHTVNLGSEIVWAKHVSGKNICCFMNVD